MYHLVPNDATKPVYVTSYACVTLFLAKKMNASCWQQRCLMTLWDIAIIWSERTKYLDTRYARICSTYALITLNPPMTLVN